MNKALTISILSTIATLGAAACGSSSSSPSNTNDAGTSGSATDAAGSGSPDGSMGSGSTAGSGDAGGDSSSGASPSASGTVSGDAGSSGASASGSSASGSSSGSSGGGTCKAVTPCGGNLVGTWTITGACSTNPEMSSPACGDGGTENDTASVTGGSGTVTFNADGTYSLAITLTVQDTEVVPLSCVTVGGVQGTCDDLKNRLASELPDGEASSLMCTSSATQCSCELSGPFGTSSSAGTYVVSGDTFQTNEEDGGGGGSVTSYCVQGNTLTVISGDQDGGTSLVSQITGTR